MDNVSLPISDNMNAIIHRRYIPNAIILLLSDWGNLYIKHGIAVMRTFPM